MELTPYGGSIELILGPMHSGKSTELVQRARRAALANLPVLHIKHARDTRYTTDDIITTHAEIKQSPAPRSDTMAEIHVISVRTLAEAVVTEAVVAIDEGQFFPDLVEFGERWANEGRRVIVAALDGSFARQPFGASCDLVARCENVTKLRGVCMHCRRNESAFTLRLSTSTELIEIGGSSEYHSVCRRCYFAPRL